MPYTSYNELLDLVLSDDTWKKPRMIASSISINCDQLTIFLKIIKKILEDDTKKRAQHKRTVAKYTRATKGTKKKKAQTNSDIVDGKIVDPIFDKDNRIPKLQEKQYTALRKAFQAEESPNLLFPRAYYCLMQKIAQRVEFCPESLEKILSIPQPNGKQKGPKKTSKNQKKKKKK